jgi:hypothetical protein
MKPAAAADAAFTEDAETARLFALFVEVFRAGLAGTIAGIVIVGVGGRIVMRISAAINPMAAGAITESENVVGEVTIGGTIAFLVFGGMLTGFLLGIVWFLVRDWMPSWLPARIGLAAALAVLGGGGGVIDSGNIDFVLLDPPWLHVAMFLSLVALAGGATAALDTFLAGRLPTGETASAIFGGLAALGLVLGLPFLFGFYFVPGAAQIGTPPWAAGLALGTVAIATCAGRVSFYRTGATAAAIDRAAWERVLGFGGVALFGLFGGLHLAGEIRGVL